MSSSFVSTPLGGPNEFNWVFLVEILIDGILALFFLFYFNRLIGTLLSYAIRAWTWHQYRAYIDISALQISPLGGRIFFKSIRYHAHNITLFVHDGHITWRYWLRMVQEAEVFEVEDTSKKERRSSSGSSPNENESTSSKNEKPRSRSVGKEEKGGGKPKKQLPCRISIKVSGVEAFIYNRSPLYDSVLEQTLRRANSKPASSEVDEKTKERSDTGLNSESSDPNNIDSFEKLDPQGSSASFGQSQSREAIEIPEPPEWLRVFPIKIECKRAAGVIGNENTTSVITGKAERASGTIDVGRSGPLDLYKLLFNFDIEDINVAMKPNRDFKQLQLDAARTTLRQKEDQNMAATAADVKRQHGKKSRWSSIRKILQRSHSQAGSLRAASVKSGSYGGVTSPHPLPGEAQWHGLARYLDDKVVDEHNEWQNVEYAKASTLADIESLHLRFYFDVPGKVPKTLPGEAVTSTAAYANDINGSKPPDYGLDFFVHGGVVTYGPWADRQRINIQQIFFPAAYVDAVPTPPLKPGAVRAWSLFKIFVQVDKDVILRIPSREPSKDDKWQGRAEKIRQSFAPEPSDSKRKGRHGRKKSSKQGKGKKANAPADARPYGWIDITVKTDTTVNYIMDMFAGPDGFKNTLDVDAKGTEISSSVNHGLLWKTGAIALQADLSQPKTWKTLRSWPFDITIDDLQLFILRDHLFLIIDLVNDWSSGALSEFYTFVPYRYNMHMLFRNFCMYLNVNDANIVNDAANFDRNDFLTLEGILDANLAIDMEQYRPVRNMITFDVLATEMRMRMLSPPRSSFSAFIKDKTVATLPKLTLTGSYSGHIEQRPGLTDTLRFDIVGSGLSLMAYGFLVRQLVNIKENYFGDYMHFKTLEEFQDADDDLAVANLKTASIPKPKSINELDVILCIIAEDATVMLPANLYSGDKFVRIELPVANLDLRILSYYLDMGLQLSPISVMAGKSANGDDDSSIDNETSTQLFVKHLDLDGHRSFGLPPNEPAYISQWNIDIGAITGEFNSSFVHDLAMAGRAFAFTFPDQENSLPLPSPTVVNDITFVQVRTDVVRIWMHFGKDALLFSTLPIEVTTNDWADTIFSQRISVLAPKVTLAVVDGRSASRHRTRDGRRKPVRTYAFFQTGVSVNVTQRAAHFTDERRKQQAHIRMCDQRTNRASFLLYRRPEMTAESIDEEEFSPACMPYPALPPPLDPTGYGKSRPASIKSKRSAISSASKISKRSSSSLSASVKADGSAPHLPGLRPEIAGTRRSSQDSTAKRLRSRSRESGSSSSVKQTRQERLPRANTDGRRLPPTTMAFSSPFSEPYFPLDTVEPDETGVPAYHACSDSVDDNTSETSSISARIENLDDTDNETAKTSVFIHIVPGVRLYVEPHVAETVAAILQKVTPQSPQETMDAFHMDVVGNIVGQQLDSLRESKFVELNIDLSSAVIRVANPMNEGSYSDQVNIKLQSVETLVRMRAQAAKSGLADSAAVRVTAQSVKAALTDGRLSNDAHAVRATFENILVWVAAADVNSVHVMAANANLAVAGEQAEFLMNLVLRLMPMVQELSAKIQEQMYCHRRRLLLLMQTLMNGSDEIRDPAFLSGLTYILRAFSEHLRNQDSWKVLMRFQYILQNLPPKAKEDLCTECKGVSDDTSPVIQAKELESWAQWRNWDVPNVSETLVFQTLFRHVEGEPLSDQVEKRLALTVQSEYIRIAIEAGEGANELIMEDLSLGLHQVPRSRPTGLVLADENTRSRSVVQFHTSSTLISFDWSAYAIAEAVVPCVGRLQEMFPIGSTSEKHAPTETLDERLSRHEFLLVISTDTGRMSIQSLQLHHLSQAENLKLSLVGTTQATERYGNCVTGILNATNATSELRGPEKDIILQTLLTVPSIYGDVVNPMPWTGESPSTVIAVGYEELQLAVKEQASGLLHVVDAIILDEATKIINLIQSFQPQSTPSGLSTEDSLDKETHIGRSPKIHLALLAGKLRIEAALLSTLTYKLEGTAASVHVAPSMTEDASWGIDFDVGAQNHAFVSESQRQEQTILDVPPINGHVGVRVLEDITSLSVSATLEKVKVDAAAIYEAIGIVRRQEVQDLISAMKGSVEEIKQHVAELQPPSTTVKKPSSESPVKPLAFDVRFALLGIRIAANAPSSRHGSVAEISFGLGPLHAVASNEVAASDKQILLPKLRAQIRNIGANLEVQRKNNTKPCGNVDLSMDLSFESHLGDDGKLARSLKIQSNGLEINAYPETASTAVGIINHLQDRLKDLDLTTEVEYLRKLRNSRRKTVVQKISGRAIDDPEEEVMFSAEDLLSIQTTIELRKIQLNWLVDQSFAHARNAEIADLILSLERIDFTTHGGHEARLGIEDLQLSLTKKSVGVQKRSLNSALLPNVSFSVAYWSSGNDGSLAFKATGKPLELRLESKFIGPVNAVQKSITVAVDGFKADTASWKVQRRAADPAEAPRMQPFDIKKLSSLLVEADFAGAQVHMQGSVPSDRKLSTIAASTAQHVARHGRYGQFASEGALMQTNLQAPGIAVKVEYNRNERQPTVNGELRIDASSNTLLPNVVPLLLEVSHTVKEVMQSEEKKTPKPKEAASAPRTSQRFFEDDSLVSVDPTAIFGKTKVDLGLRICKQEFGLSCQPIARIDAKAAMDDFYVTVSTINSDEHGQFFAVSSVVTKLSAQVKHMYSREPTFSYDMDSITLSVMNNKHLSGTSGISAVLKINPTRTYVNAKQLQDLLLFREIWVPPEVRSSAAFSSPSSQPAASRPEDYFAQRYQAVAAAAAFPWNATIWIAELAVDLDLGQSIGKSSFSIKDLWASQAKSSNSEQNLCIGMQEMAINSTGRMSGFLQLGELSVRTAIKWPGHASAHHRTPLIQASIGFQRLRAKAAFDYQAFAFGDIEGFDFLMYNVRQQNSTSDRLVAVLDCEKAYVFCTSTSPAQAVGLYQAFDRLIQEKQMAFAQSLRDIEKHLRRESTVVPTRFGPAIPESPVVPKESKSTISLHTDVVLTMGTISFGVFPSTFFDSQILKLEANNIQTRFAVSVDNRKIHSSLGMTLGQLQVALASARRTTAVPKALDVSVDDVVTTAVNSKGGIILRVPKVIASMQTWQGPNSNSVDYIFKSLFAGKIDVGWNLSRINFIKGMWNSHSRALASRLGKALPESAVKITAGPAEPSSSSTDADEQASSSSNKNPDSGQQQEKITAEVTLPQSRYEYRALEPPVIETPQLRDMGEATPPLEWIGLHRDRLPNAVHQVIIVSLLEVAKEVEDAYEKILGSS